MNKVVIIGRLVKTPELRYTNNQMAVCRFTVAVDRFGKEKQTDFPSVVVFGKVAENCEKFLDKGNRVALVGHLQTGSYEKDGKKYYTTDVVAEEIDFIDFKQKSESAAPVEQEIPGGFEQIQEDIPF